MQQSSSGKCKVFTPEYQCHYHDPDKSKSLCSFFFYPFISQTLNVIWWPESQTGSWQSPKWNTSSNLSFSGLSRRSLSTRSCRTQAILREILIFFPVIIPLKRLKILRKRDLITIMKHWRKKWKEIVSFLPIAFITLCHGDHGILLS